MRGEGCVAGEGRVVGVPKFHSWGKCTMSLTNINSDWMSNASSGLCINLCYLYYITRVLYFASWGVILYYVDPSFCILGCNITWILYFVSWGVMSEVGLRGNSRKPNKVKHLPPQMGTQKFTVAKLAIYVCSK